MRPLIILGLSAVTAIGAFYWYGTWLPDPEIPMEHVSTLSDTEYRQGSLRKADTIARRSPRLTEALEALELKLGAPIFVRIFKETKELEIWVESEKDGKFHHFKTWPIAAMSGNLGPKLAEGDRQAPEGFYHVGASRMKPDSSYHLAFNVGYPNTYDRAHGRTGSFIMVHGNRVSIGCFAMTDYWIEEIYTLCDQALENGQPYFRVHIFPFRITDERLSQEINSPWYSFWKNLQDGYEWFETHKTPPNVTVREKRYVFGE